MKWLLNLYPRMWQERYRDEVEAHLDRARTPRLRTSLDLIAGAIDAWLHPDLIDAVMKRGGNDEMMTFARIETEDFTRKEGIQSAWWMIGISLVLTTAGVVLDKVVGEHIMVKALLFSAFPISFTVGARYTYLKPYSRAAQNVIIWCAVPAWYVLFLSVTALTAM